MSLEIGIVGQGIAGSLLGRALERRGASVTVIDRPSARSGSVVAAGIASPITGKRHVATWGKGRLISEAEAIWRRAGEELGRPLVRPLATRILFGDEAERDLVRARLGDEDLAAFAVGIAGPGAIPGADRHGSLLVRGGFRVDVASFLELERRRLAAAGRLVVADLRPEELEVGTASVRWRGRSFQRLALCAGFETAAWPGLAALGFRLSRGELIEVTTKEVLPAELVRRGRWLLPGDAGIAAIGSTYDWTDLDAGCTASGRRELLAAGRDLGLRQAEVRAHRSGVRGGANDSLPYVGTHPFDARLTLFTAFGSKAVLTAPPLAELLADHLIEGRPLPREIDVARRRHKLRAGR